ncbi:MAG: DUF2851 family protein [Verrucomicrobiota bacterium]|nr:DUF2851 family protein [Verrucomicrobiota bacterium]
MRAGRSWRQLPRNRAEAPLDLQAVLQENSRTQSIASNFYERQRLVAGESAQLHETRSALPPELLLQQIWHHQRLLRKALRTVDGRTISVLHPGFWNVHAGPDFQQAIIQIENEPPRRCDIEIDVIEEGWKQHQHEGNPAFARVGLHVIWDCGTQGGPIPQLAIKGFLDSPLEELSLEMQALAKPRGAIPGGNCCGPLSQCSASALKELLRQAALVRLRSKALQLGAWARQSGWEQALWEGLFVSLGYSRNVWPMKRIAEIVPWQSNRQDRLSAEALLFGISGLLPRDNTQAVPGTRVYIRSLWDVWWRVEPNYRSCVLPKTAWNLAGLRPLNSPERRLAVAADWLSVGSLISRLEAWLLAEVPAEELGHSAQKILAPTPHPFWDHHFSFKSRKVTAIQPLGTDRAGEIMINMVLPWFWIRAVTGKNERLRERIESRYFAWPALADNSALRFARARLFSQPPRLRHAAFQQGMLQILRDFCDHSDALCNNCRFPELVGKLVE